MKSASAVLIPSVQNVFVDKRFENSNNKANRIACTHTHVEYACDYLTCGCFMLAGNPIVPHKYFQYFIFNEFFKRIVRVNFECILCVTFLLTFTKYFEIFTNFRCFNVPQRI